MLENTVEYYYSSLFAVFFFPALGGFLFGYDIGATSFVVAQIAGKDHAGVSWDHIVDENTSLQGAITSASVLGALLASIAVFKLSDDMGRKTEIIVGAALYVVGSIIEAVSSGPDWSGSVGITLLILGRVVYGLGIGFSMHGAPAYIGEMSPPSIRGLLISLKEAAIVVGILLGYLIGYLFFRVNGGWGYTYGFSSAVALVMGAGGLFLKESSRWLYLKGYKSEAKEALLWILKPQCADETFASLAEQEYQVQPVRHSSLSVDRYTTARDSKPLMSTAQDAPPSVWAKRFRPALIAGVGLVFLQQVTGQPSVLYYAATIFEQAGLADVATVGVAAFKLVMTLIAVFTVDKFGRRLLLFIGISVMLVALIMLTAAFYGYNPSDDDDSTSIGSTQIAILTAMFIYIGGYQIGFGPIAWLLISEVFPLEVRGQAVAVAVQTNFFWNVVTSYLFPLATEAIGPSFTFGIFALIDAFAIYFVFAYVPETKGLSLEEIEVLLGSSKTTIKREKYQDIGGENDVSKPLISRDNYA